MRGPSDGSDPADHSYTTHAGRAAPANRQGLKFRMIRTMRPDSSAKITSSGKRMNHV